MRFRTVLPSDRKVKGELRAARRVRASRCDKDTAVDFGNGFGDGKSEAKAWVGCWGGKAVEFFEDRGHLILRDPFALIGY